jgi:hypothetical protein
MLMFDFKYPGQHKETFEFRKIFKAYLIREKLRIINIDTRHGANYIEITITFRFLALPLPLLYFLRVIHYITIAWVKVMHYYYFFFLFL